MPRTTVYIVSEDTEMVEKAKTYFGPQGVTVTPYSPAQWRDGLENPNFRGQLSAGIPALAVGNNTYGGNVLPFPGTQPSQDIRVSTMNELEHKAIESAIAQYRGNLTEAAKALGIGRATLYRKVKQYQIDPGQARKKRAA
ncbi:MAG: hypothetical protein BroJett040_24790 [Oligoflexia bacterium]|nr:MAG: hypothetical protein BroJett040_24790 [Oligoflexia bacterium]